MVEKADSEKLCGFFKIVVSGKLIDGVDPEHPGPRYAERHKFLRYSAHDDNNDDLLVSLHGQRV